MNTDSDRRRGCLAQDWITRRTAVLLLVLAVAITFWRTLEGGFVWDDFPFILWNNFLHDPGNLLRLLIVPDGEGTGGITPYYRPVTTLSFALNYYLFGENYAGYALINLVLHSATVSYTFLLLAEFVSPVPALLAAALFAVHPANVEPIAYVSARGDLLCGLGFAASLYHFIRHRKTGARRDRWLSWAASVFSIYAKIVGLVIPILIFLHLRFVEKRRDAVRLCLPYVLAAVSFLVAREWIISIKNWGEGTSFVDRLPMSGILLANYFRNTILPFDLKVHYDIPFRGAFSDPGVALSWLVALTVGLLLLFLLAKGCREATGLALYLGALVPVSGLPMFLHPLLTADRYLYVPLIGFSLFLAVVLERAGLWMTGLRRTQVAAAGIVTAAGIFAFTAAARIPAWKDPYAFWDQARKDAPLKLSAHIGFAKEAMQRGNFDEAEATMLRLVELGCQPEDYLEGMASLRYLEGRLGEARSLALEGISFDSHRAGPLITMGFIALAEGDREGARRLLEQAWEKRPNHRDAVILAQRLGVEMGAR